VLLNKKEKKTTPRNKNESREKSSLMIAIEFPSDQLRYRTSTALTVLRRDNDRYRSLGKEETLDALLSRMSKLKMTHVLLVFIDNELD
jgi:hypothetical protein